MIGICDQNGVDNTPVFQLLLSSAYKTSIPSHDVLAVSRLEARRSCEGLLTPADRRNIP